MPKNRSLNAMLDFLSPISEIPGMGEKRVIALSESGITTIGDLLYWFPKRYIDRSSTVPIAQISSFLNSTCTIVGVVKQLRIERGKRSRLRVLISDESGSMELLWFQGVQFYSKSICKEMTLLVTGKVTQFGHYQMVHPTYEIIDDKEKIECKILPWYSITNSMKEAGVQQKLLVKALLWILKNVKHYPQVLPLDIEKKKAFPPLQKCLSELHFPDNLDTLTLFSQRIKYEELYTLAVALRISQRKFALPGRSLNAGNLPEQFKNQLPFKLTPDQETAINILYKDAASTQRMHRLLQGDVGSGKTLVAFFASLPALNNGLQVVWLTPTEILAHQTYNLISSWLKPLGFSASILTGSISSSQKQTVINNISANKINFVVGTHALLQPAVKFHSLGMIIIDEQHRFGAQQRLAIQEKDPSCDFLLMSATPIPQTLAKTLYGDLNIVSILKPPQGRTPVSTHIVPDNKRYNMEQFVLQHLNDGEQAYYIVPRIERDEDMEEVAIKDIETTFDNLKNGSFSSIPITNLHGQLSNDKKEWAMEEFSKGNFKLLVATSVVEVGIDVPNATIMVIENAERFGLAQLHQLRGRVGRGQKKSFCFLLLSDAADEEAQKRISQFCRINDGFKIAEFDLKLRGPGQVTGFRQSGWDDLNCADILRDADLFKEIQNDINSMINF